MNLKDHMDKSQERDFVKLIETLITEIRLLKNEISKMNISKSK